MKKIILLFLLIMNTLYAYAADKIPVQGGFSSPTGIAFDRNGAMYVANWSTGIVTKTLKGKTTEFIKIDGSPSGLAFDTAGNLYIADYMNKIYQVTPDGKKSVFAEGLDTPTGIAFNNKGELLVANRGNNQLITIAADGKTNITAQGLQTPVGAVQGGDGTIYVTNYAGGIMSVKAGQVQRLEAGFSRPGVGIVNFRDKIYAVDYSAGAIRDISGTVLISGLKNPVALTVYNDALYVGCWGDGFIYRIE